MPVTIALGMLAGALVLTDLDFWEAAIVGTVLGDQVGDDQAEDCGVHPSESTPEGRTRSSSPPTPRRPLAPAAAQLDEYVAGNAWQSLSRLALNNSKQDPSYARTCLTYGVFRNVIKAVRIADPDGPSAPDIVNQAEYGLCAQSNYRFCTRPTKLIDPNG
mgnify:CR=1 FL=1